MPRMTLEEYRKQFAAVLASCHGFHAAVPVKALHMGLEWTEHSHQKQTPPYRAAEVYAKNLTGT